VAALPVVRDGTRRGEVFRGKMKRPSDGASPAPHPPFKTQRHPFDRTVVGPIIDGREKLVPGCFGAFSLRCLIGLG